MNGRWIIFWDESYSGKRLCDRPRKVASVTEKLIKLSGGYPRQISKDRLIADFSEEALAIEKLTAATEAFNVSWRVLSPLVDGAAAALREAQVNRIRASHDAALAAF